MGSKIGKRDSRQEMGRSARPGERQRTVRKMTHLHGSQRRPGLCWRQQEPRVLRGPGGPALEDGSKPRLALVPPTGVTFCDRDQLR